MRHGRQGFFKCGVTAYREIMIYIAGVHHTIVPEGDPLLFFVKGKKCLCLRPKAELDIFFSPFRVFLPVAGGMFALGLINYAYTFFSAGRFTNMSALLFTSAVIVFMIGLVSEQISQISLLRQHVRPRAAKEVSRKAGDMDGETTRN